MPEETAETLEDGWLKTGDLGYVDEEEFVFLTGRKKNLIITPNGENVSPEEIENKLSEKRIFPAIDIAKSGTRRDDLLLTAEEMEVVNGIHKALSGSKSEESIEEILKLFVRTKNNQEFIQYVKNSLLRK